MTIIDNIMELAEEWRSSGGRKEHAARKEALRTAIEQALGSEEPVATVTSIRVDPDGVVRSGLDREVPLMTPLYTAPQQCKHERVDEDLITGSWSFCKHCHKEWTSEMEPVLIDKACWERGCACYDSRVDKDPVKVTKA
jgi:hypothetical protein